MSEFTERLKKLGRESIQRDVPEEKVIPGDAPTRGIAPVISQSDAGVEASVGIADLGLGARKAVSGAADATTGFIQGGFDRLSPKKKIIGPQEQLEIDKRTMPSGQFALKYGKTEERARDYESQDTTPNASVRYVESIDNRSGLEAAKDVAVGAGKAAFTMTADLTGQAVRAGLFGDTGNNEAVGSAVSDIANYIGEEAIQPLKSAELLNDKAASARAQAARLADSAAAYEASDKSVKEQFRKIGRDAVISADAASKYSGPTSDVVAEGVGSMLPSLAVAGGAKTAADVVLKGLSIKGLSAKAIESVTTAAAVGAMEGSSAYSQTRRSVMEMDAFTLREESPVYNELRAQGLSHEDAQIEVAKQAAMKAQVITTLVAAGISLPFTGFEGGAFTKRGREILLAPSKALPEGGSKIARRSTLEVGGDLVGQTIEEGAQGASGQYFQNLGIKDVANQDQDITAGVGDALTQGAIGGLGASAAISAPQAPGLYLDKMKQLAGGIGEASAKYIGEPLAAKKALKVGNKLSDEFGVKVDGYFKQASDVLQAIDDMDAGKEISNDTRAVLEKARGIVEPLREAFNDTSSDAFKQATKKFGDKVVPGSKVKTLENLYRAVTNGEFGDGSKLEVEASAFVSQQLGVVFKIMSSAALADQQLNTKPAETQSAAPDGELDPGTKFPADFDITADQNKAAQDKANALVDNIFEVPVFAKGIKKTSEVLNEDSAKSVEEGGAIKPVQSFAEVVMNPIGVDPARITADVKKAMPEEVLRAVAVVEAIQAPEHAERMGPLKGNRTNDAAGTRQELIFRSKSLKRGEVASFNDMVSQLLRGAIRNKREGQTGVTNTEGKPIDAVDVWTDLQQLIKHQQNKFNAAKDSYEFSAANPLERDTSRKFDSLSQKSGEFGKNNGSIFVKAGNEASTTTFRNIAEDLNVGIRAYNALLEQFPELYKGKKLQEVPLPAIEGASERAATSQTAKPAQPAQQSKSEQAKPAEVVADPVVDNGPRGNNDSVQSDKISFADLFKGGTETTFADALLYMMGLGTLDPVQEQLLALLTASGFARANPKTIVRQATAEEKAKATNSHGWWDGKKNEIVLIEPRISKLQHEMIHATTLEVLVKSLASGFLARAEGKDLSRTEKAAIRLNDDAIAFMEDKTLTGEALAVQAEMWALVDATKALSAQEQRAMVRAISEYMAYGLSETNVRDQLNKKIYKIPELARKIGKAVGELLVGLMGNKQRDPATSPDRVETALSRLFIDTQTLALDGKPSALKARAVKEAQATNAKAVPEKKAAKGKKKTEELTAVGETPGEQTLRFRAERDALEKEFEDTNELPALRKKNSPNDQGKIKRLEARKEKFDDELSDLLKRQKAERGGAEPAQAEVFSAPAEKTDTTLPADDGPELAAPVAETKAPVEESVAEITKAVTDLLKGITKTVEQATPAPVTPAAEVSATTPTPEAAVADATGTTAAENAPATSAASELEPMTPKEIKAYKDLAQRIKNLEKKTDLSETGQARLESDKAKLAKQTPRFEASQGEVKTTQIEAVQEAKPAPVVETPAVVQPAAAAPVSSKQETFEAIKALRAANKDLVRNFENAEKRVKSMSGRTGENALSPKGLEVLAENQAIVETLNTDYQAYKAELARLEGKTPIAPQAAPKAAVQKTEPAPVVETAAELEPASIEVVEVALEQAPENWMDEAPPPEPPEEAREIEQDVGLPEDWKPAYNPLKTLVGVNGSSFLSQIIKFLEPKLQPGDSLNRLIEFAAPGLGYNVTPEMKEANERVKKDAFEVLKGMQAALAERFVDLKDQQGNSMLGRLQAYQEGKINFNPVRSSKNRYMAWLDGQSIADGKPQFDNHLLMLAIMATADFVMNTETGAGKYKPKDIMKVLGLSNWGKVTPEMIKSVNAGRPGSYVKDSLAAHIRDFMGAQVNNDMSQSETDGVFEALAHEILDYLATKDQKNNTPNFWVKANPINVFGRTVTVFSFGKPAGWQGKGDGKRLLRDVLTSKSSDMHRYSVGRPWPEGDVTRTLKRNKSIKTTKRQREATEAEQNTPFYFSKDFWEMYTSLLDNKGDARTMAFILGWRPVGKDTFYNDMDRASVEGKNASVRYGIQNAMEQIEEIRAYAEKHGMEPHEVPVYYRISIGANTRSNFEGYNPKGDKFSREMFSPTRHTINLKDPRAVMKLYAAVAQALGVKVEDVGLEDAAAKAKSLLGGKFAKVLAILETGDLSDAKVRQDFAMTIANNSLEEEGAFTLKALWVVKKLNAAIARGDTEFETDMYMELDGKTNGPIAAAIQHFLGAYSPEILATWRRGGYFLGNDFTNNKVGMVYSQWKKSFGSNKPTNLSPELSSADFYGRVGQLMGAMLIGVQKKIQNSNFFSEEPKDPEQEKAWIANANRAFENTLGLLNEEKGISVQRVDGELVIVVERGATKSPITQNLYGAGLRSISLGLAGDIVSGIYADLTKLGQGDTSVLEKLRTQADRLETLLSHDVLYDEFYSKAEGIERSAVEGPSLRNLLKSDNPSKELMQRFKFSEDQFERLSKNVQAFYLTGFKEALDTAVDPSVAALNKRLIKGAQVHGKIYKRIVNKALREKHKEMVAAGLIFQTQELPKSARNEVIARFEKLNPNISNGLTTFNTLGNERESSTDVSRRIFGQKAAKAKGKDVEVDNPFEPRSRTQSGKEVDSLRDTIGEAESRILALNTQTNSDVTLQIESWTDSRYPKNSLAVYDGNNQATDQLEAASEVMNEAMGKAWHTNTLRPILEAYDRALEFADGGKDFDNLKAVRDELERDVIYRDARIEVEKRIFTSFQGVPGADVTFTAGDLTFENEAALIKYLNDEVALLFSKKMSAYEQNLPQNKKLSAADLKTDYFLGALLPKPKFAYYFGSEIYGYLEEVIASLEDPDDIDVVRQLMTSEAFRGLVDDHLVVDLSVAYYGAEKPAEDKGTRGVYYLGDNTVKLYDQSAQVAIHELLHVATAHQVHVYYTTPQYLSKSQREIMKGLEELTRQFTEAQNYFNFFTDPSANLIREAWFNGDRQTAVSEFITYGLTNPTIRKELSELGVYTNSVELKRQIGSVYPTAILRLFDQMKSLIRKMFGFSNRSKTIDGKKSFLDNLRYHTYVLGSERTPQYLKGRLNAVDFTATNPADTNLDEAARKFGIQTKIGNQVTEFLKAKFNGDADNVTALKRAQNAAAYAKAKNDATDAMNTMAAAGFTIDGPQDTLLFQSLYAVIAADTRMDKVALQELQQVYNAVIEKLGTDSFRRFGPAGQTGELQAIRMYAAVLGQPFFDVTGAREFLPPRGPAGVERLASFIALAQVSPELRQILSEIDMGALKLSTSINTQDGLDGVLGSLMDKATNRLTGRVLESKGKAGTSSNDTLDLLTDLLLTYDVQAAVPVERAASNVLNGANNILRQGIEGAGAATADALAVSAKNASSDLSRTIQELASGLASLLVDDRASVTLDQMTGFTNNPKFPEYMRNLFAEIRSINLDTVGVLRLVKKAKDDISRMRQEYIDQVPKIIRKSFGPAFDKLKPEEKKKIMGALFKGLGKTDFGALDKLVGSRSATIYFGTNQVSKNELKDQIRQVKESIAKEVARMGLPKNIELAYLKKAEQLADYMINKKVSDNQLTSAVAILNLHNEDGYSITETEYKDLQKALLTKKNEKGEYTQQGRNLIDLIDGLASLEAVAKLDDETHNTIHELLKTNRKAVLDAIDYQRELHRREHEKVELNSAAALNGIKGHFTTNSQHKHTLVVANNADELLMKEQGFTKMRAYNSAIQKFDPNQRDQSYYFSAHHGLATYNQGAMQTVQDTYFGTDPTNGSVIGPETTSRRVTGKEMLFLNKRMKAAKGQPTEDGLLPRFGAGGKLIGLEEAVSNDMFEMLNQTNDYADSLGRWAGRIEEEKASHGLNFELIDAMKAMYDKDMAAGRGKEYASFGREKKDDGSWDITEDLEKDPIWRESYFLMPKDAREYAESVFGGPIKVRRDMINNSFGFRSMSVADVFTGKSRLSAETQETVKKVLMATPILGKDAFKYFTAGEEILQGVVSGVKHIIVVKSGVVMVANTISNVLQLASREVPLTYIAQRTRSKWAELERYKQNEDLKIQLRYDYLRSKSNAERSNIQARIYSIDEANKKMTIWPLIQANQFTTISEGLTDTDREWFGRGFGDWIERKAGELPGPLSTVARYALVAKDTALYQGLAKGVQYSDFISKAIYYDFLTQERGMKEAGALLKIDQEFINYDLNDSRMRSMLEANGLTWFMNFKLRSLKIGLDMMKNNPASVLLALAGAGMVGLDTGTPVTDNAAALIADGRIWYSTGFGMMEAGWSMNLWNQMFGSS